MPIAEIATIYAVVSTVMVSAAYWTGRLAAQGLVAVGYTRKLNHFILFLLPGWAASWYADQRAPVWAAIASVLTAHLMLVLCWGPVRCRSRFCDTVFQAIDRPEDRPYTLFWLWSQMVIGYLALLPWGWLFLKLGRFELIQIPVLINGVGDGLAEVVGVRFGRHKYRVRGFWTDRIYTRSWEGSFCVWLTGVIVISIFSDMFTPSEFWLVIAAVPLAMTLAEAWSPHTWDTPLLFSAGGATLVGIVAVIV